MDDGSPKGIMGIVRIVFPYLVFITVFILAGAGMAIWGASQT